MHPRIMAQRSAAATQKLVSAAQRLAADANIPGSDALISALTPATNNSQIKPMLVLEACANLVEAVANSIGSVQPAVRTARTVAIETPEGEIEIEIEGDVEAPAAIVEPDDAGAVTPGGITENADTEAKPKPKVKRGTNK